MTERDALLKAVCDHPDDDTPRLVFADWLQENGEEERAEFIRLQIQLHRGRFRPSEEARLERRLKKFRGHTERLKAEFPEAEDIHFSRGFIERAAFIGTAAFERAFRLMPLRWVTIHGPIGLPVLMALPGIDRVACVVLTKALTAADLVALAGGEWLKRPGELLLSRSGASLELVAQVTGRHGGWAWFPSRL